MNWCCWWLIQWTDVVELFFNELMLLSCSLFFLLEVAFGWCLLIFQNYNWKYLLITEASIFVCELVILVFHSISLLFVLTFNLIWTVSLLWFCTGNERVIIELCVGTLTVLDQSCLIRYLDRMVLNTFFLL